MNSLLLLLKFLSGRHSVSCSFSSFHTFFSCSFIIISCPLNTLSISFVHHFLAFCFHLYRKELFSSSKKSVIGQKSLHFVVQSDERFPSRSKPDSLSVVPSVWEPQDTPRSSATSSTEPPLIPLGQNQLCVRQCLVLFSVSAPHCRILTCLPNSLSPTPDVKLPDGRELVSFIFTPLPPLRAWPIIFRIETI